MDVLDLHHVRVEDEFFVATLGRHLAVLHDDDVVGEMHEVDGVSHQDSRLFLHQADKDLVEDRLAHVWVQCRDRVVHDEQVRALVHSASEGESGLLTSREVDSFLTDLSLVTSWHDCEVRLELARENRLNVSSAIEI